EVDACDDASARNLLGAVAKGGLDDPWQTVDLADGLLVFEGLLVHADGLELGQQVILPNRAEKVRLDPAAVLLARVEQLGDAIPERFAGSAVQARQRQAVHRGFVEDALLARAAAEPVELADELPDRALRVAASVPVMRDVGGDVPLEPGEVVPVRAG